MTTDKQNSRAESGIQRVPSYTVYKPNRNGTGAAVTFNFNRDKQAVFVEAANQMGEKRFDWERKIIMKWGMSDLGTILAALQNRLPESKLFHQTERANSACCLRLLEPSTDPQNDSQAYRLIISKQDQQDKSVSKVTVSLTVGEAAIIETALKRAIERILQW